MVDFVHKVEFVILRLWVVYLHLRDICEIWRIAIIALDLNFLHGYSRILTLVTVD